MRILQDLRASSATVGSADDLFGFTAEYQSSLASKDNPTESQAAYLDAIEVEKADPVKVRPVDFEAVTTAIHDGGKHRLVAELDSGPMISLHVYGELPSMGKPPKSPGAVCVKALGLVNKPTLAVIHKDGTIEAKNLFRANDRATIMDFCKVRSDAAKELIEAFGVKIAPKAPAVQKLVKRRGK